MSYQSCSVINCDEKAKFVKLNEGKYCEKHNIEGTKKIKYIYCFEKKCTSLAKFGITNKEFCIKHKSNDMINFINKCNIQDCNENAFYNFKGKKPIFCKKHMVVGMINLKFKKCIIKDCAERAYYSTTGENATYCVEHKNIVPTILALSPSNRCITCGKVAIYGVKNNNDRYCKIHKTDIMYNLKKTTIPKIKRKKNNCKYVGCDQTPSFNLPGLKPLYCKKHITDGMINVKINKTCKFTGCTKQPTFGLVEKIATHCKKHKENNMFDVYHKLCEENECNIRAIYGNIKDNIKRFCFKHKINKMVNLQDLKWKCKHKDCTKRSYYGKPGSVRTKCFEHREIGMIRRPNGQCLDCLMPAIYGINYIPKHCETHKKDNESNLVEKKCISCKLIMILDKNNKCEYCNPEIFKKTVLEKQNSLMNYLDKIGLKGNSTDKRIDNGDCGLERPDRVYDLIDKIIILECDEHQHKNRNCTCEQTRMVNIGQSFGGTPVYFIRFNPDDYISLNNKQVENIQKRYKLLGELINSILTNKITLPKSLVSAFYMYYDDWDGFENEEWKIITAIVN
jgi:hypothetical protein